ncbi:bifunctional D-glycero-beta-D-manno-heptose-7-phosphate kinase/D-glycero-beta-D-manno-heptose 1-phosphate adenylyltransferase HldE [Glaciecola sp. 1036]|uniref:bifunctional D-glycero-beta-D-manno-heptose-7-phosphate kinase/D-glycero-beta-D-manno-heptose 1-phosphate adenylyltransferase HldE n=1 Tax=Alteromonadaceae TaxID=72275 RepID=UPI003D027B81
MQLPDFSKANILILGDLMLDRYWTGATARISPEAPVPVVNVNEAEDRPGGAANVAVNAAALGAQVTLLGFVGEDESANILKNKLAAHGINTDFISVPGFDTITKLRIMSRHQQLIRLDFEKSFASVDKQEITEKFAQQVAQADVVILSDYAKGALTQVNQLITLATEHQVPVVVDPKGSDFSKYAGASVITPNLSEFELVYGAADTEDELAEKAFKACVSHKVKNILLTRSEKGMSLFSDGQVFHNPALAKEVYDVTGAGDTVVSTLACALAVGSELKVACQLANHAAGVVVGKLGTSTVTNTELALAINSHKSVDAGVLAEAQLIQAVQQAKDRGEKVVFTNGCFDILHAGHVSYLQEAAALGDRLIVAVNSDESVRELKGEGRPVNNVNRRMAVLAGLQSVDWVVEFTESTPHRIITALIPDILVKGGDYKIEDIVGAKEVVDNGGKVYSLSFEDGVSTTGIITQILNQQNSLKN